MACIHTAYLSIVKLHCIVWIHYVFQIHSSFDRDLGYLPFLAIMNNTAMNIYVQFVWTFVFTSLGYIPRSGIAESYKSMFKSWMNCQTVFQSDYILHSEQHCMSVLIILYCYQYLLFRTFLIMIILLGVR